MHRFLLLLALPALVILTAPQSGSAQIDVEGPWILTLHSPEGTNEVPLNFGQSGEDVTATFAGSADGSVLFTGTATDSGVRFLWSLDWNGMPLDITMTGELRDGRLSGVADFSGLAEGEWTARRPE
jgi:hypothetical protein